MHLSMKIWFDEHRILMHCRYPEVDTLASHHTLRPHPQKPGKAVQDDYGSVLSLIGHSEEIFASVHL